MYFLAAVIFSVLQSSSSSESLGQPDIPARQPQSCLVTCSCVLQLIRISSMQVFTVLCSLVSYLYLLVYSLQTY
jgi:hypothetical protein